MPYLLDHGPQPDWAELRDDSGHLYGRVQPDEWLLEVQRNWRMAYPCGILTVETQERRGRLETCAALSLCSIYALLTFPAYPAACALSSGCGDGA